MYGQKRTWYGIDFPIEKRKPIVGPKANSQPPWKSIEEYLRYHELLTIYIVTGMRGVQ